MKKALITGIGGFCGRHLAALLRSHGLEPYGMGVFSNDAIPYRLANTADVPGIVEVLKALRPDVVFHLAGAVHAKTTAELYQVNTVFAASLLDAYKQARSDVPILLVGSAAEYGPVAVQDLPVKETHPCSPVDHYGISKLAQTLGAMVAAREIAKIVVVRPFNIIGAGMPEHLLLGTIARQIGAAGDAPGTVIRLGSLHGTRDFLDVKDGVQYYWELVRQPAAYGEIINVCSGKETKVNDLVHRMLQLAGFQGGVESPSSRKDDDANRIVGDPSKLLGITGRDCQIDLDTSLLAALGSGYETP